MLTMPTNLWRSVSPVMGGVKWRRKKKRKKMTLEHREDPGTFGRECGLQTLFHTERPPEGGEKNAAEPLTRIYPRYTLILIRFTTISVLPLILPSEGVKWLRPGRKCRHLLQSFGLFLKLILQQKLSKSQKSYQGSQLYAQIFGCPASYYGSGTLQIYKLAWVCTPSLMPPQKCRLFHFNGLNDLLHRWRPASITVLETPSDACQAEFVSNSQRNGKIPTTWKRPMLNWWHRK